MTKSPSIYLAGFDVFRKDAVAHGQSLKALCSEFGMVGIYPLDNELPEGLTGADAARWIFDANVTAIRTADLVMANVDDFRGPGETDSGTAFEIGYAIALGKPVWAYTSDRGMLIERVPGRRQDGHFICERGYVVEDFQLSRNLMIACSARIVLGDANACLKAIHASLAVS